jgi:hypothetical protein
MSMALARFAHASDLYCSWHPKGAIVGFEAWQSAEALRDAASEKGGCAAMSTRTVSYTTRGAIILSVGLYLVWVLATYLLEGRIYTFLRPEAMGARLTYALVANVIVGIGGSALVIRFLSRTGTLSASQAGFRGLGHAAIAVVVGVVAGFALYVLQGPLPGTRWSSSTPTRRCSWAP